MSGLYHYDLHTHSCASFDCKTSFDSILRMAKRRGLSGIALTDHDTMDGVRELQGIWPQGQLDLIAGCERTLHDGTHIIGLFLHEAPRSNQLREVVAEIREQGGLVYLPHPFREYSGILGAASRHDESEKKWISAQADIIEVFNRKCTAAENHMALELANALAKPFSAASDAHAPHEIGMACTTVNAWMTPGSHHTVAAMVPPENVAAREVEHRSAITPSMRTILRSALKTTGLLPAAKAVRNQLRQFERPTLVRYK